MTSPFSKQTNKKKFTVMTFDNKNSLSNNKSVFSSRTELSPKFNINKKNAFSNNKNANIKNSIQLKKNISQISIESSMKDSTIRYSRLNRFKVRSSSSQLVNHSLANRSRFNTNRSPSPYIKHTKSVFETVSVSKLVI